MNNLAEEMETIDQYLTEEDKEAIRLMRGRSKVKAYPGSIDFQMFAEANRVKKFVASGSYSAVLGFGVDYILNRGFTVEWEDCEDAMIIKQKVQEILFDLIDQGHTFDESQLDKLYAWIHITPYKAMLMTDGIRQNLYMLVDLFWPTCVLEEKSFGIICNKATHSDMIDLINEWSDRVVIPHKGVGSRKLLV
tara:strand:- start:406 stop:981 length:576 start_codon:yes stop_codon:yes gene_type:complete